MGGGGMLGWLSVEYLALDLRVMSSSPRLGLVLPSN